MSPWYISNLLGKTCCSPNNNQPFRTIEIKKKISRYQLWFSKNRFLMFYVDHLYIGLLVEIMIAIEE